MCSFLWFVSIVCVGSELIQILSSAKISKLCRESRKCNLVCKSQSVNHVNIFKRKRLGITRSSHTPKVLHAMW
uniref:Putative secreted protein n=1 Tax=Anopheles darlingi TaxID=43151 RepID=A0A2M4DJ62_ANODA